MGAGLSGPGLYYCPWTRCFVYHTIAFGAACTLPCCGLRGISGGATMTIEALVGFGSPILPDQGPSYVRYWACVERRRT
jgi:hypothetical protein